MEVVIIIIHTSSKDHTINFTAIHQLTNVTCCVLYITQVQRPSDPNPFRQGHRVLHRFKDHQIHRVLHRFKDHQIQTHSDNGTESCTGSKTIRSKPVQTRAPSLAQVQRPSDPNPFRQGHRVLHRFKDPQIQTRSDKCTESCTGSKTIRSKPVQTRLRSLAQVLRPSNPN